MMIGVCSILSSVRWSCCIVIGVCSILSLVCDRDSNAIKV